MTKILGILNLTPDSFSDGGLLANKEDALFHAKKLIEEGADIIDIGAESTNPLSNLIEQKEEIRRLEKIVPNVIKLANDNNVKVSIDTRNSKTAEIFLEMGAYIINDVSGISDSSMPALIAKYPDRKIILMHNLGLPANRNVVLKVDLADVVNVIIDWFEEKITILEKYDIGRNQIIIDPGIGFGKNREQSLEIINNVDKFKCVGVEVLIGHSRKSFMHKNLQNINSKYYSNFNDYLDLKTAIFSSNMLTKKIDYLRVHNVLQNKIAIDTLMTD